MAGLYMRDEGRRIGISNSPGDELREIFGSDKWGFVNAEIAEWASSKEVDPNVLYAVLLSEVKPKDWRKWPKTWLGVKRVHTFFESLKPAYWIAFKRVGVKDIYPLIDEWNKWCEIPVAKMGRKVGRPVSVRKLYWMGKGFKDLFVIKDLAIPLTKLYTCFVNKVRDSKVIEPYLWKWYRDDGKTENVMDTSKYQLIESGE